MAALE